MNFDHQSPVNKKRPYVGLLLAGAFAVVAALAHFHAGATSAQIQRAEKPLPQPSKPEAKPEEAISLLVEQGHVLPSQALASVVNLGGVDPTTQNRLIISGVIESARQLRGDQTLDVTFSISGGARFEDQSAAGLLTVAKAQQGVIRTPAIVGGARFGESFLRVLEDGQPLLQNIRVVTLAPGGIENLKQYFHAGDAAVLALGEHFAVIDQSKAQFSDEGVTISGQAPVDQASIEAQNALIGQSTPFANLGICIRTPFGPGKVNWSWNTPGSNGQLYSIKPESSGSLLWATAPSDDIDAIYRRSWGCGTALKVPDSCTLTWNSNGSWSSCCNAAAAALGHVPQWVYPPDHGFPYCPL